jgi:hypothetical protein
MACLFIPLTVSLNIFIFNLMKSNSSNVVSWFNYIFVSCLRNFHLTQNYKNFSLCFLLEVMYSCVLVYDLTLGDYMLLQVVLYPPNKTCLSPNSQYLRMQLYLKISLLHVLLIKMRSLWSRVDR